MGIIKIRGRNGKAEPPPPPASPHPPPATTATLLQSPASLFAVVPDVYQGSRVRHKGLSAAVAFLCLLGDGGRDSSARLTRTQQYINQRRAFVHLRRPIYLPLHRRARRLRGPTLHSCGAGETFASDPAKWGSK